VVGATSSEAFLLLSYRAMQGTCTESLHLVLGQRRE